MRGVRGKGHIKLVFSDQAACWAGRVSNLCRDKRSVSSSKGPEGLWDPLSLLLSGHRSSFFGVNRPGR